MSNEIYDLRTTYACESVCLLEEQEDKKYFSLKIVLQSLQRSPISSKMIVDFLLWTIGIVVVICALLMLLKTLLRNHLESKPIVALRAVFAVADSENSAKRVIQILDTNVGLNMSVGAEKGALLDELIVKHKPRVIVEFGAYYGYSAVRMANLLGDDGMLYSIEIDPLCAAIASQIVERAGLSRRVRIIVGPVAEGLSKIRSDYGVMSVNLFLVDHAHDAYVSDVRTAERLGLMDVGTIIVADNMRMSPEYRQLMEANPVYESTFHFFPIKLFGFIKFDDGVLVSQLQTKLK
jgi:catechol O-methyltransferase